MVLGSNGKLMKLTARAIRSYNVMVECGARRIDANNFLRKRLNDLMSNWHGENPGNREQPEQLKMFSGA